MNPTFHTTGQLDVAHASDASRMVWIGLLVLSAHAGLIWAIQNEMSFRPPEEIVIPVTLQSAFVTRSAPVMATPKSEPEVKTSPVKPVQKSRPEPKPVSAPKPTPVQTPKSPTPAPQPAATATPAATSTAPAQSAQAAANIAPATPAPATVSTAPIAPAVQLPSSNADYLKNPAPVYPALSLRMNEQGQSLVKVLIGSDGQAQRAELAKSSGYDRLDRAAVAAVLQWRFVPGKRGGIAEAMWYQVPINWKLRE
ncbi:Protein TonB [Polaromonas vacuolata]|uniref:Protein TonB n=1 Tax=Polaromonas vacuolata TaxID=37448 RepID=A0A6H2H907_9BURK|nr:energy transducer TonB [Polaromonas vacuolata]QJC56257.1 Protein TonB [Polaromonas vacuolata]